MESSVVSHLDKMAMISDSVIIVKNVEFKVHKAILSNESDVFLAMFSSELCEGQSGRVEINDVDPKVFAEFLHFIYTKTSPKMSQFSIKLMELANKYMVHQLLSLCVEFLTTNVCASNVCDSLIVAHRLNRGDFKKNLFKFVRNHLSKIVQRVGWMDVESNFDLMTELISSFLEMPQQKLKIKPNPNDSSEGTRAATWTVVGLCSGGTNSPVYALKTISGSFNFTLYVKFSDRSLIVRLLTQTQPQKFPVLLRFTLTVLDPEGLLLAKSLLPSNFWTSNGEEFNFEVFSENGRPKFDHYSTLTLCVDIMHMKEVPCLRMNSRFKERDELSDYFDASFIINLRVFKAHRAILAGKSQFFYDLFKNPNRVAEPHYVITETTEEAFEIILNYLYTDEFPPTKLTNLELLKCSHTFVLPDMFKDIELYCYKCMTVESAIPSLIVADKVGSELIETKAVDIIAENLKVLLNSPALWSQLSQFPYLITPILIKFRENCE